MDSFEQQIYLVEGGVKNIGSEGKISYQMLDPYKKDGPTKTLAPSPKIKKIRKKNSKTKRKETIVRKKEK
jgi:hypothetical protein